ncbi:hypothetical protein [Nodosilinea sp. P-1105]|nr:hypothetical protein [Nodosilinea sp. P-1105]
MGSPHTFDPSDPRPQPTTLPTAYTGAIACLRANRSDPRLSDD